MSSAASRKFCQRDTWNHDDTVVVDMREFLSQHAQPLEEEATVVIEVPDLQRGRGVRRRPPRRHKEKTVVDVPVPPPLHRALARQKAAARQRQHVAVATLRKELEASERARAQLTVQCRDLRLQLKRRARDTKDSLARARLQGTIDHLRANLERAEMALARQKANSAESVRALEDMIEESMRTIERLTNKVAHLERERTRAVERLEDLQMDRAGQAMQIAHLNMSLVERGGR